MKLIKLTIEEIKADYNRVYNPIAWEKNIDEISKYSLCQFYKVEKGNGFDYDRFFVIYQIPEGIIFLDIFGYSASLTNNPFKPVKILSDGTIEIEDGVIIPNNRKARKVMSDYSKLIGAIYSNIF